MLDDKNAILELNRVLNIKAPDQAIDETKKGKEEQNNWLQTLSNKHWGGLVCRRNASARAKHHNKRGHLR